MTPIKLLIGQILIVFAVLLLGVWAATQWAAAMLGYQNELGVPWFSFSSWPFYWPWALFGWWYNFEAYAPHVFSRAGALAGASGFMGCAAAVVGSSWRARQVGVVTTFGSTRWAKERDIARAALFGDAGVFLGSLGNFYLRHDGTDVLVLVSGVPPLRARKLRYFDDRNFQRRVLGPPALNACIDAGEWHACADDWSGRVAPTPAPTTFALHSCDAGETGLQHEPTPGVYRQFSISSTSSSLAMTEGMSRLPCHCRSRLWSLTQ
jgi:type IV secretory pathway TraG/TraD family ATPase VirD4